MKSWPQTIAVLFALPIFSLLFFIYASNSESNRIKDFLIDAIHKSTLSEKERAQSLDFVKQQNFAKVCAEKSELDDRVWLNEHCKQFHYYSWARIGSIVLLVLGALHLLLIAFFARRAKRSKSALLDAFKAAWVSSVGFSLLILLGQTGLLAVTFFYVTTILFNVYIPKLLAATLFLGAYAFYRVCRVMLERITPLSQAQNADEVSEQTAPKLWAKVRCIAERLGTKPPDTIMVGMETSCYVTEFPVMHAQGITMGRTLYLSAPIMQKLSDDEMASIIGHEMGHFKGEDTLMTRELSPCLIKSEGTLRHLREAILVGLPAFYAMLAFRNLFEEVISTHSRERELAADACGAYVTTPKTAALALVRYCFECEIHDVALEEHLAESVALEITLLKHRNELLKSDEFWNVLMSHGLPHPFDSHPPVKLRIEKLGFTVKDLRIEATELIKRSAFDEWLDKTAITNAVSAHDQMVKHVQEQILVAQTPVDEMSEAIIAKHFPKVVLKTKTMQMALYALENLFFVGIAFICIGGLLLITQPVLLIPLALLLIYLWFRFMRRYYGQTLTIDYRGVQLSSWAQPIAFSEIESLTPSKEGFLIHRLKMIIEVAKPVSALYRQPLLFDNKKRFELNLYLFEGSAIETGERLIRYFQRGLSS